MKLRMKAATVAVGFLLAVGMAACAEFPSNTAHNELNEQEADKQDQDLSDFIECASNQDCPEGHVCSVVCREYIDDKGEVNEKCFSLCGGEDPEPVCSRDEDCIIEGMPKGWCVDGQCVYDEPMACLNHQDCPEGFVCERYCEGSCDQAGNCDEDCYGKCVPKQQDVECRCDQDCVGPTGQMGKCMEGVCVFEPIECREDSDCPPEHVCNIVDSDNQVNLPPHGVCVPKPAHRCRYDGDCPPDHVCQQIFPEEPDSWLPYGICVPAPEPQCRDNADCPFGSVCQTVCWSYVDSQGFMHEGCYTECIPDPSGFECKTDEDCVAADGKKGFCRSGHCYFDETFCLDDDDCPDDFYCEHRDPIFERGICVPGPDEGECRVDADCPDNFHCDLFGPCENCEPIGRCVPGHPPQECKEDSDCPPGFVCQMLCADCDPTMPYCEPCLSVCVPKNPPTGCKSDEDCQPGFQCDLRCPPCPEGDPTCADECIGMCVPIMPEECTSDADCISSDGTIGRCLNGRCIFEHPECTIDEDCIAPEGMRGWCVAGQCLFLPHECEEDSQCPEGHICQIECKVCPDLQDCDEICYAICVPQPQPECITDKDCLTSDGREGKCVNGMCYFDNQECHTDQDCPIDHTCVMECWDCSDPNCEHHCRSMCVPSEPACDVDEDCLTEDGRKGNCDNGKCIYPDN